MEKISCPRHRESVCLLKTGTKPGYGNFGKSFYMCFEKLDDGSRCDYVCNAKNIRVMSCKKHHEMVGIRYWHKDIPNRILYCCKKSKHFCGYFDIEVNKENQKPAHSPKKLPKNPKVREPKYIPTDMAYIDDSGSSDSHKDAGSKQDSSVSSASSNFTAQSEEDHTTTDDTIVCSVSNNSTTATASKQDLSTVVFSSGEPSATAPEQDLSTVVFSSGEPSATEPEQDLSTVVFSSGEPSATASEPDLSTVVFSSGEHSATEPEQDLSTVVFSSGEHSATEPEQDLSTVVFSSGEHSATASEPDLSTVVFSSGEPSATEPKQDLSTVVFSSGEPSATAPEQDLSTVVFSSGEPSATAPEQDLSTVVFSSGDHSATAAPKLELPIESSTVGALSEGSPLENTTTILIDTSDCESVRDDGPMNSTYIQDNSVILLDEEECSSNLDKSHACLRKDYKLAQSGGPVNLIPIISPPKLDPEIRMHSSYLLPSSHEARGEEKFTSKPTVPSFSEEKEEGDRPEPIFKVGYQSRKVIQQIQEVESSIKLMAHKLPDKGAELYARKDLLYGRLNEIKKPPKNLDELLRNNKVPAKGITGQARMLTTGAVEHLHESLKSCPTEDVLSEDPTGIKVVLMHHQKRALAWMKWREEQNPSAGILADDMGLGKTLTMLSLVAAKKKSSDDPELKEWLNGPPAREGLIKTHCTLVVCPASLMIQWEKEIRSKFRNGTLHALVYHGSNRTKFPRDLVHYDIVITSYHTVGSEGTACPSDSEVPAKPTGSKMRTTLFQIHWQRIVLDEAHVIRNHKTGISKGACFLSGDSRWALTGTPIQNKISDFYSLIKFIQLAPFDDYKVWRDTVDQRGLRGMRRLNTMISSLVLRRTKEELEGRQELTLTRREIKTYFIDLCQEEKNVFQVIFSEARKVMCKWLAEQGEAYKPISEAPKENSDLPPYVARLVSTIISPYLVGSSGRCVLGLLLRLRQCCCHLSLLTSVLDKAETNRDDLVLEVAMGALTLDTDSVDLPITKDNLPVDFTKEKMSTKIQRVIEELSRISAQEETPYQKSIIVSQWTGMLDIVAYHLDATGITHSRIDGKVSPRDRQGRMEAFNVPNTDPMVMLLSLQAGGVGLDLIGANHVFMLDMHWNPALEVQAADRCHRMGQKRDVFVHKFVCKDTVEEKIFRLQEKKLMLAKNVLEGASEKTRKARNQLSLSDLKDLFEI